MSIDALLRRRPLPLSVLAFFMASTTAFGQTVTGTVQGTIRDSSGGVLPGVSVTARDIDTGRTREAVSNEGGYYNLPFLPLGRYDVSAALSGFKTTVRAAVEVQLNATRVVDFDLSPADVAETVTVRAEVPRINTTNGEIKGSLTQQEIEDRPTLNPGSFLALAETFAGFGENPTSGQNNPTASSGSSINFNGAGTRGATFQINGVNNDDSSENQNRQGAALSTIKEFQVISNSYSAEFGRGYGAVVLVQTKSGTNTLRGDVYEFRQESTWNARSAFALTKPNNARDQYGFTAGFPIRRNRAFAFVSADKKRFEGFQTYTRDLFLPSELAAPRLTRDNDTPENRAFIENILSRFPNVTPNDPRSPRTYQTIQPINQPADDHSLRLDWSPRAGDMLTARYQWTRQIFESGDIVRGEQARQNNRQANTGITWTTVMGASTVAEFRYGLGQRRTRVGIAAGNDTPIVRFALSPVSGSIIGNAGNFPIDRDQTDQQLVYNVSRFLGRSHQVKAGTDLRFQQLDDFADNFGRGFWSFNPSCGGTIYASAYAAFLDGCVTSFQKAWGPFFLENRVNEYNVYAEDNWRVRSNLTINLGVRYEYVDAPREREGRLDYGFGDDRNNLEPRVGFAYTPGWTRGLLGRLAGSGPGTLSLRGGFGLYDGRIFQSVFSQTGASLRTNPPLALSRTFTTTPGILNLADPTLGFVFTPGPQTTRHTLTIADAELEMPRTRQWNVTLERQMPFSSTIRVSYTGTKGVGLLRYLQDNLPQSPLAGPIRVADHPNNPPAAGFPDLRGLVIDRIAADVFCAGTGLPGITVNAQCPVAVPIANNEVSFRVPRTNERRPDPRYATNLLVSNDAESWYHGVQVEWTRRLTNGLWFQTSYTWSRSEDTTSEATFVGAGDSNQLGPNVKFRKGFSRFHTPHRYTFNGSYRLPVLRDRTDVLGSLLGGWVLSGVLRLAHGTPFTVIDGTGRDLNFDGFTENRPILLDPSILGSKVGTPATSTTILARDKFRSASFGEEQQIIGRNTFFGDGLQTVDLGLYKTFRFAWGHDLTLRFEAYNAFNIVQYGFPTTDIASANFGRILGGATGYAPRVLQVAVRYRY
ncbi:MAG: carboxypeptidase regulatory-like domain-containing protein [Acidobacteriota bacterium]